MVRYIIFTADVQLTQCAKLRHELTTAVQGGATELYLAISSGGGLVVEGLSIASFIKSLPVEVTTHNIGLPDSIANVIFASGKSRLANTTASFLFHGISQPVNSNCSENQLFDIYKGVVRSRETLASNIAAYTGMGVDKLNELMISGDTILSAQLALAEGLIHEIKEFRLPNGADFVCIANS